MTAMTTVAHTENKYPCAVCHNTFSDGELNYCVVCRSAMCNGCTQFQYPNRFRLAICSRCPLPHPPPFACGRCHQDIATDDLQFFCEMCGDPICFVCIDGSFEAGMLKCESCCDRPLDHQVCHAPVPYLLTEDLLGVLAAPACAPATVVSTAVPAPTRPQPPSPPSPPTVMPRPTPTTPLSKYHVLLEKHKLGEGAQGVVYKCHTVSGEVVVSKEMIFDEADSALFESQLRQAQRMRVLNHPHLIRYLDVVAQTQPLRICVIMPYYDEGDLKKYIERQQKPVPELKLCSIVLQIAAALKYLHTQDPPLVHRDIKPENILLLNNEEQVLLMDLDLCSSTDTTASVTRRRPVSPTYEYRAPELEKSVGSPRSDVFSLGVVTYVLATLPEFPCVRTDCNEELVLSSPEWTTDSLERAIRRAVRSVHGYRYSDQFVALLVRMLAHNPAERPTSSEVWDRLVSLMELKLREGGC